MLVGRYCSEYFIICFAFPWGNKWRLSDNHLPWNGGYWVRDVDHSGKTFFLRRSIISINLKNRSDHGIQLICSISAKEGHKNYHRIERCYGKFQRSFHLPNHVKADGIKANYKNGVFTMNIPKNEATKPKEIAIS